MLDQLDIYLQDAVADEIKIALNGYKLINANNELANIHVYTQYLPVKKTKNDTEHFPYVLVCFDESEITDEDSKNTVLLYFLIGIQDDNPNKQGFRDVLCIANKIYQHLFRKRTIQERYRMQVPFKIKLQEEDTHPYYIGGIETRWELPAMEEEDDLI